MRMAPGFSSYTVGWAVGARETGAAPMDAAAVLELGAKLGYRRVQLADNTPLHDLDTAALDRLAARARELGVAVEVGTRGLTAENVTRYTAIAAKLHSPFCRVVIDAAGVEPSTDEVIAFLRTHVALFARSRVVLAIENHDRFKAAELARIIEETESPWVAICLDTANSLGAAEDIHTVLAALAPHTINVHLKDIRFRRVSYAQGFHVEGVPLGEGQIPLEDVLDALRPHGRCITATLEHWVPPEAKLADTIAKERAWCERSTARMRQLFPEEFVSR
jgi:sugar phosphate isomerase/epimerase